MALGCLGLALAFADALVSRHRDLPFFHEAAPGAAANVE
jgi:hypothetical protein